MGFSQSLILAFSSAAVVAAGCVQTLVPLTLHATNYDLSDTTYNTTYPVSGTFALDVSFCPPTNLTAAQGHANTLLVTAPGATYGPSYWDFPYHPETYSFVRYANARGFAVLNFARIGTGNSAHPDPQTVVQLPLQIAAEVELLRLARQGLLPLAGAQGKRFSKLIGLGHSLSSAVLNGLVVSSPNSLDGAVFSGYSHVLPPNSGLTLIPANSAHIARFAALPAGYLTTDTASTRAVFYGPAGTYDAAALAADEARKDVVAVGELGAAPGLLGAAPAFRGDVLAVNGLYDKGGCDLPACAVLGREGEFYGGARSFESAVIPDSGHDLNLHLTAPVFFNTVISWAERHGF